MPRAGLSSWKPSGFRLLLSGLAPRTTTARISLMLFLVILAGSALLLILLERATQTQLDREAQALEAADKLSLDHHVVAIERDRQQ